MKAISILNQVLGPVMRGPSSSHTAGAYHIASMVRGMMGGTPRRAVFIFDPAGSYARTYAAQGADRAFAMGLLGKPLTDDSFFDALDQARREGLLLEFRIRPLKNADHPNAMEIEAAGKDGADVSCDAKSTGGGEVEITNLDGWPVRFDGSAYEVLVETRSDLAAGTLDILRSDGAVLNEPAVRTREDRAAVVVRRGARLPAYLRKSLESLAGGLILRESPPVYFIPTGRPLFTSAADMVRLAEDRARSLGQIALDYETRLLGMSPTDVVREVLHRYDIMADSVGRGLDPDFSGLQLLAASAGRVYRAEHEGRLTARSLQTRAAARAMAVMHVDGAMGVVCAAPTGGSAGTLPGTLVTLAEERNLSRDEIALALLAAGIVGVIVAARATFAAEVAGCQVEIGAAGAMAAAAVVDGTGGTAHQASDAAAIAFQNTMGSVCDLVQGVVEIPCHTRNAVAAANAFICADLVLGGYVNPIPLDETIDAVYAVGKMLPAELRCTSRGGLALAPSALRLPRRPSRRAG